MQESHPLNKLGEALSLHIDNVTKNNFLYESLCAEEAAACKWFPPKQISFTLGPQ